MPADIDVTLPLPGLWPVAGKPIIARFDGGSLLSDGGLLALREVEARLGVAARPAGCINDSRAPERIRHGLAKMLRFRLLMIAAGHEDGNDAESLRHDPLFKLAIGRLPDAAALCLQPTISRLEDTPGPRALIRMARAMVALYCASWRVAQFHTLRLRLMKLAARVVALKTRVMPHLPSACPDKAILRLALERLPRLTC